MLPSSQILEHRWSATVVAFVWAMFMAGAIAMCAVHAPEHSVFGGLADGSPADG